MASEVVEALACCCWTSVLGFDAVELRSLAGCGGDWVELFGTGDAGPNEDEVLLLEDELLLLLEVKSELLLGLWVRLFPDAFRFEPTRLRKREGIGLCLAPSTLHMPRDKRGRHTQAQTGTRGKAKKGKAGRKAGAGDGVCRLAKEQRNTKGGERSCGWSKMRPEDGGV
jgi:hypothetical protein